MASTLNNLAAQHHYIPRSADPLPIKKRNGAVNQSPQGHHQPLSETAASFAPDWIRILI